MIYEYLQPMSPSRTPSQVRGRDSAVWMQGRRKKGECAHNASTLESSWRLVRVKINECVVRRK